MFVARMESGVAHTVNHDVLMSLLGRTIADKRLLGLIGRYLRAGVLVRQTQGQLCQNPGRADE